MNKPHCDICDKEIRLGELDIDFTRLPIYANRLLEATVHVTYRESENKLDICKHCLIDALNQVDDRVKE